MNSYEIRLLTDQFAPSLIIAATHSSDRTVITAARRMANGKPFEVWHDLDCIHKAPEVSIQRQAA